MAVLWLGGGVLVLLCLAVALPTRIALAARTAPLALRVRLAPAAALPFLTVYDSAKPRVDAPKGDRQPYGKGKPHRSRKRRGFAAERRALVGVAEAIRFESLRARGRFGLGDPAETGAVFGLIAPLAYGTPSFDGVEIALEPDFGGLVLDGEIEAVFAIRPAALIAVGLTYLWHRARSASP
ncbi:MAG: DUF2953 domain-containing protein [Rubricella sp.]